MTARQVTCGQCGDTFESGWTEEEAEAEAVAAFGAMPADPVLVCDECYTAIMAVNGHRPPEPVLTEVERHISEQLQARFDMAMDRAMRSAFRGESS